MSSLVITGTGRGWLLYAGSLSAGNDAALAGDVAAIGIQASRSAYGPAYGPAWLSIQAELGDDAMLIQGKPAAEAMWEAMQRWPQPGRPDGRKWPPQLRALAALARFFPTEYQALLEAEMAGEPPKVVPDPWLRRGLSWIRFPRWEARTVHHAHHHAIHVIAVAVAVHPHVIRAMLLAHAHAARLAAKAAQAARSLTAAAAARIKPRISVITPTWRRRELLTGRCIPSVLAQDYGGEIEHVIVSDGPDPELAGIPGVAFLPAHVPAPNRGVRARLAGTAMAAGELIAYLDDDNSWRPGHLSALESVIAEQDVSFAYSQAMCRNRNGLCWVIGCSRPVFGQIDTSLILHKRDMLRTANWWPSGRPADWDLVDRWLQAGATWAHVPEITLDYFARSSPLAAAV